MADPLKIEETALAPKLAAPQHKPRPLTLFLEMLRSETAAKPQQMRRALEGLRRYQEAPRRPPLPTMPAVASRFGAALRDYGGEGPPVLFVPSLINPPTVLDLPYRSLLRWLAERGHRPLLLDWGWDVAVRRDLSLAGHVEEILLPMLRDVGEEAALVGYCLGGTMAVAAAALAPVRAAATIAAPWHFSGFPHAARTQLLGLWRGAEPAAESFGALPMEVLQSAFWSLDPARTVAKFEDFAAMSPGSEEAEAFVALEDWANDGPPLPLAAARELFEELLANDTPGTSRWQVSEKAIDPAALPSPLLNIISTADRIVPQASAITAGDRLELDQGHVGMVVGSQAHERLWQPLAEWLSQRTSS
jgi:polyhydroxyalkanoate synthase